MDCFASLTMTALRPRRPGLRAGTTVRDFTGITRRSLLALAHALAFQFGFHIAHQRTGHPALGRDPGGVVGWTIEVEIAGDIHIELALELQAPFKQPLAGFIFRALA